MLAFQSSYNNIPPLHQGKVLHNFQATLMHSNEINEMGAHCRQQRNLLHSSFEGLKVYISKIKVAYKNIMFCTLKS